MDILVVDDSASTRKVLLKMLLGLGYSSVSEAENGIEAWERLQVGDIDLMITDWDMPSMSGPELVEKVRADANTANLPILMSTARSTRDDMVAAIQAGANNFISKPFNRSQLESKIAAVLAPLKVLIAEDSRSMRQILKNMLFALSYSDVHEAVDGQHAWEQLQETRFDLLICDWNMPEISGLELINLVRGNPQMADVSILMSTVRSRQQDVVESIRAGANGYITKPFSLNELGGKVEKLITIRAEGIAKRASYSLKSMLERSARSALYEANFPFVLFVEKSIDPAILSRPLNKSVVSLLQTKLQALEKASTQRDGGLLRFVLAEEAKDVIEIVGIHGADVQLVVIAHERAGGGITLAQRLRRERSSVPVGLLVESVLQFTDRERKEISGAGIFLIEKRFCTPKVLEPLFQKARPGLSLGDLGWIQRFGYYAPPEDLLT